VEAHGGSDGTEIQQIPWPVDWCFVGPPSENPHCSRESVHLQDVQGFLLALNALAAGLQEEGRNSPD
jgi:di/tripeptidase